MTWDGLWVFSGVVFGPVAATAVDRAVAGVPVFAAGWWRLRGNARTVTITAATCGLLATVVVRFSGEPRLPALCWGVVTAVPLAATDLACHRLPRPLLRTMAAGAVLLLGQAAVRGGDLVPLGRALAASALLFALALVAALLAAPDIGAGDVRLFGVVGLYLGWSGWDTVASGVLLALGFAGVTAGVLVLCRRLGARDPVALAPPVLIGVLTALVLP